MASGFETYSVTMRPLLLMTVQTPVEDVERIMAAVTAITPLVMGAYDSNAFVSGPGTERYRPLEGAAAGAEADIRSRPGVVEVSFELPDDRDLTEKVVEAVFQVHSYQEPVIRLQSILASRSKGHDDRKNPNRWWNTTGDWKGRSSV
ncbi:hypothetical protein [Lichenifustis flavocetrariae]|uniref:Uncharacterized protein n=1 Tax=Lichenifustis flavocetrariae TaxID=2949735 RepID=A0AA42CK82_9HYPH|nr:hypothetical protein [Lichenifustis flavocetrariae]MCW6510323.1 hypothetical protein [Lichenifustis flavocetrariae]